MKYARSFTFRLLLSVLAAGAGATRMGAVEGVPDLFVGFIDAVGNPVAATSGSTITFAPTLVDNSSPVTFVIGNRGTGPGSINGVSVTGDGFQLSGAPLPGSSVAAGQNLSFTVRFTPTQPGSARGGLQISTSQSSFNILLDGTGIAPVFSYEVVRQAGSAPLLPSQTIPFPDAAPGSQTSIVLRVRNTGSTTGTIADTAILGASFRLGDVPFFPLKLRPNESETITVVFAPSQLGAAAGRLRIGTDTFNLSGLATGPVLTFSSGNVPVQTGGEAILAPVMLGTTGATRFSITNTGTAAARVTTISADGSNKGYSLLDLPPLPITIPPGGSASFTIGFAPSAAGASSSTLKIDQSVFMLVGSGTAPPALPAVSIEGASGVQEPLSQIPIGLTLADPYPSTVNGTLSLSFDSDVFSNDPAIQFATGGRSVSFTIPANSKRAIFTNGATQVKIQTGSVAGTIGITPSFSTDAGVNLTSSSPAGLRLAIAASAPRLLSAQIDSRSAAGFSLTLTGLATGRNVKQINLHFVPLAGVSISGADVTLNLEQSFGVWFQNPASQQFGGLFSATVPISIQGEIPGSASLIDGLQSVTITATNQQGVSSAQTVQFR